MEVALAYASHVRHHPISGIAVVKSDTVEGYVSAATTFLADFFNVQDLRVNAATGLRFPLYLRLTRSFRQRDPARRIRSAFTLDHLRRARTATGRATEGLNPMENWAAMGIFLGLRTSEFLDSGYTARRLSFDGKPRGILDTDVRYVTWGGVALPLDADFTDASIGKVRIRFREQKNGDNGIWRDCHRTGDPFFDPVSIMLDSRSLFRLHPDLSRDSPLAIDTTGKRLTAKAMAAFVKATARDAAPGSSAEDIALFTCHSVRVGALQHLPPHLQRPRRPGGRLPPLEERGVHAVHPLLHDKLLQPHRWGKRDHRGFQRRR